MGFILGDWIKMILDCIKNWKILKKYIRPGFKVAELYNGEKVDILLSLSNLVKSNGIVYGVDKLNPFERYPWMKVLQQVPNIRLLRAETPPLPIEAQNLDAIIIREFCWTCNIIKNKEEIPMQEVPDPETYNSISFSLNNGGYLILYLKKSGYGYERQSYGRIIDYYFEDFVKIYDKGKLMMFQKGA